MSIELTVVESSVKYRNAAGEEETFPHKQNTSFLLMNECALVQFPLQGFCCLVSPVGWIENCAPSKYWSNSKM